MSENDRTDRPERSDADGTAEERSRPETGSDRPAEADVPAAAQPAERDDAADRSDERTDLAPPTTNEAQPERDGQTAPGAASKVKNEAWEWIKALVIAFGLAFLIRYFLFGSYIVDGPSMKPNFHTGERLIVNKILYDIREPKRGEVIVFHAPTDKDFIKRVIALPGETIKVQGDTVYINGQPLPEPYLQEVVEQAKKTGKPYNDLNWPETKVPEGTVFVLGDNRSDSTDSRMIGPVSFDKIVGRAEIVFWPVADWQYIH